MDVLVLYSNSLQTDRKTIYDHLYCFERYLPGHRFYYLNVLDPKNLDQRIQSMPFDAVIMHYTMLSRRYLKPDAGSYSQFSKLIERVARMSSCKIMLPQDDYNYTADLWRMASECNVDHIFSVMPESQLAIAYPKDKIGHATVSTVLTGYIDEASIPAIEDLRKDCVRDIDIGYRARKLPYWFGWFGQLKMLVAERFRDALAAYPDLHCDIVNTDAKGAGKALLGDDWMRFLLSCRCMLGCLGGSSILDPDGSIVRRVDDYCAVHPEAEYEEVHQACFPTEENSIRGFAPSPRIFEYAMTKTCQLLVEGDYNGIIQPGVDYIEIKQDFSNVDEVLELVRDHAYCQRIAEQCYEHVIRPGDPDNPYTYRWFANHVIDYIETHRSHAPKPEMTPHMRAYLAERCTYYASKAYLKRHWIPSWCESLPLPLKLCVYIWIREGRRRILAGIRRRLPEKK